ncbi:MAG: ribonuclease E inhibitor RraB [Gaiellaceae bacterium]
MSFLDRLLRGKAPDSTADADRIVIRQLLGRGADLSQPRHVIHVLYFSNEADARRAAEEIGRAGYDTTLTPPDGTITEWSVRAEGYRIVGADTVEAFRAWFEEIAIEFRGEYDGWEAAVEP